jgi:hypothetical protein
LATLTKVVLCIFFVVGRFGSRASTPTVVDGCQSHCHKPKIFDVADDSQGKLGRRHSQRDDRKRSNGDVYKRLRDLQRLLKVSLNKDFVDKNEMLYLIFKKQFYILPNYNNKFLFVYDYYPHFFQFYAKVFDIYIFGQYETWFSEEVIYFSLSLFVPLDDLVGQRNKGPLEGRLGQRLDGSDGFRAMLTSQFPVRTNSHIIRCYLSIYKTFLVWRKMLYYLEILIIKIRKIFYTWSFQVQCCFARLRRRLQRRQAGRSDG